MSIRNMPLKLKKFFKYFKKKNFKKKLKQLLQLKK